MRFRSRKALGTALSLTAGLFLSSTATAQQIDQLVLSTRPTVVGPGDDVVFTIDQGTPGDYPFLAASTDPGPTLFPIVGQLELGLQNFLFWSLPAFDANGHSELFCPLTCNANQADPYYSQAVSIRLTGSGPVLAGKSNPFALVIDDNFIQDCNGNLIDDDCEIAGGMALDCNGNGIPDDCDPDCNNNGIPDDCDITNGTSQDCDGNGVPDECDPDCDGDGIPDACDPIVDSFCVTNLNDDGCYNGSVTSRIVWLQAFSPRYFTLIDGSQFTVNNDGTATMSGTIERVDDPNKRFYYDVTFSGRVEPGDPSYPPMGSPKLENGFVCSYDPNTWVYYTGLSGTMTGMGDYAGAAYDLTIRGPAFQLGVGANLRDGQYGGASWFDLTQTSPPNMGSLPATSKGDFNLGLTVGCDCDPPAADAPFLHYDFGSQTGSAVKDVVGACDLQFDAGNGQIGWVNDSVGMGLDLSQGSNGTAALETASNSVADGLISAVSSADAMTVQVYFSQRDNDGRDARLISYSSGTSVSDRNFTVLVDAEGNGLKEMQLRLKTTGGTSNDTLTPVPFAPDTPTVVTMVYGDAMGQVRLYVDGLWRASWPMNGELDAWTSRALLLGNEDSRNRPFNGTFYDVKVWASALTSVQVADEAAAVRN